MRDNFTKQTINEIARGVGYRCSNPSCGRTTVAANEADTGTILIGDAAHICAASPGGRVTTPTRHRKGAGGSATANQILSS